MLSAALAQCDDAAAQLAQQLEEFGVALPGSTPPPRGASIRPFGARGGVHRSAAAAQAAAASAGWTQPARMRALLQMLGSNDEPQAATAAAAQRACRLLERKNAELEAQVRELQSDFQRLDASKLKTAQAERGGRAAAEAKVVREVARLRAENAQLRAVLRAAGVEVGGGDGERGGRKRGGGATLRK